MGLLDGNLDPQTASTLALAGGLLSPGSFGQGLTSGLAARQAVLSNAQDMDIKKQTLEMSKLQYAAALRNQNLINDYLSQGVSGGATPQQPPQPSQAQQAVAPGTTAPSSPTSPMNPNMQPSAPASPAGGPFGGLPANQWLPDLAFNGGKNIGDMVTKYNTPASFRPGGFAMAPNGQTVSFPQSPEGFTANRNPDGSWTNVPVQNAQQAIASTATSLASGKAGFAPTSWVDDKGVPHMSLAGNVFPSAFPGFPGNSGAAPAPAAPSPANPNVIPPAVQASRDAEALKIAQLELQTTPPGPQRDQLTAAIARMQSGQSPVPANLGSTPQNLAPAGPPSVVTGLAPGVATGANNAQDTMTASYRAVSGANNSAQTVQARLDQIAQFAKGAILGGDTSWRDQVNNLLSIANVSDRATDRKTAGDLLDKNASQIALAIGTGAQGTDALRSLAAAANPSRKMNQPAINEAVAQLQAAAQGQQAKAALLTPLYNAGNTAAYNTAEQQFDANNDFRIFQIAKATQGMNKDQAQAYFRAKGYTPEQIGTLMQQKQNLIGLGVKF